jgi:hypothetical protein
MKRRRIAQLSAAATVGAVSLFGGLAAANALPGAAQGVASEMLSHLGLQVGTPNDHAGTHPDGSPSVPSTDSSTNGQGSTISDLARNTSATGVAKGAAVSSAASSGQSQAGQHGQTDVTTVDTPPTSTPPVSVPVGPPASTPPVSVPVGPPAGLPPGPPTSTPPVSVPAGPLAGVPPASVPPVSPPH